MLLYASVSVLTPLTTLDGPRIDESSQRRINQEIGNSETEQQKSYSCGRPTIAVLPLPSILVGYASFMSIFDSLGILPSAYLRNISLR